MNVFTTGTPENCKQYSRRFAKSVTVENNFEQVIAMAKLKELDKLCIFMDVWNCSGPFNQLRGQAAARKIHEIDPSIPIIIWDGREFIPEFPGIPPAFQITGEIIPVKNSNELYLSFENYKNKVFSTTIKFFRGTLKNKDVPVKECVNCFLP